MVGRGVGPSREEALLVYYWAEERVSIPLAPKWLKYSSRLAERAPASGCGRALGILAHVRPRDERNGKGN
jgi:hypothetical protein